MRQLFKDLFDRIPILSNTGGKDEPIELSEAFAERFYGFSDRFETRLVPAENRSRSGRTPFQRDVDRIKYTREFRRLKDVTQVARAGETYLYHDRLSHSLKVAQVGRRFAEFILRTEAETNEHTKKQENPPNQHIGENQDLSKIDRNLQAQIDPSMVEAACLAHDLGHPPFGHLAEETLDELLQERTNPYYEKETDQIPVGVTDIDNYDEIAFIRGRSPIGIRFEGNAQTFRILTRLVSYRDVDTGLGLTVGTLNAIQKYPYGRGEWVPDNVTDWDKELGEVPNRSSGKFGYYKTEASAFEEIREYIPQKTKRTVAADIMDYADDLTYAIHDLTDFYMDGRVPLDRLLRESYDGDDYENVEPRELSKLENELEYADGDDDLSPTDVINSLTATMFSTAEEMLMEPYEGTSQQRDDIEEFTSFLVEDYLNRVYKPNRSKKELENDEDIKRYMTLEEQDGLYSLSISKGLKQHVDILQQITKYYVIRDTVLMGQQRGEEQMIRELFEALYDESKKDDLSWSAIPKPYSDWIDGDGPELGKFSSPDAMRARVTADFIASMTEPQVIELHKRLTGDSPGSLQNEIVR